MKNNISKELRNLLETASWYEGRIVDISETEANLNNVEIEIFAAAKIFLMEYNGLTIKASKKTTLYIDALKALDNLREDENDFEQIKYLDKIINKKLCPVGVWGDDILLISVDGEIVFLWIWDTVTVSKNFISLLERYYVDLTSSTDSYSIKLVPEQIPPSWKE